MIITFVMDQYGDHSNGTTVAARRVAEELRKNGHEVRILTALKSDVDDAKDIFVVPQKDIPFVTKISAKQGMVFGKPDKDIIIKAINKADVVHTFMPFPLSAVANELAKEFGIATTSAFHVAPEVVSYYLGLEKIKSLNSLLYTFCKNSLYKNVNHVHCPTEHIKNLLVEHGYDNTFHVISNGVDVDFVPNKNVSKPNEIKDKFVIISVGRFSPEKRQELLIKAVKDSKYENNIQIILAGKGAKEKKYRKLSSKLTNPIMFKFFSKDELINALNYSDLYVHTADLETESIACVEAFSCGLVPIISNNKLSATKGFALTDYNLFEHGDEDDLRKKIEFLYENRPLKENLSEQYIKYSEKFKLPNCVRQLEDMFKIAVEENSSLLSKNMSEFMNSIQENAQILQQQISKLNLSYPELELHKEKAKVLEIKITDVLTDLEHLHQDIIDNEYAKLNS